MNTYRVEMIEVDDGFAVILNGNKVMVTNREKEAKIFMRGFEMAAELYENLESW